MEVALNVLVVEDCPNDVELAIAELRQSGFAPEWIQVSTEREFLAELNKRPDIVLSDYSLPQFTGLRAAQLLKESGLNIPFILISGTIGEDMAVEAMKHGATDYLLKDRISRLGNAVQRAIEQKRLRDEREQLSASLSLFRALVDRASDGIDVVDPDTGRFLDVNQTSCERLGYAREELLSMTVMDIETGYSSWSDKVAEIRRSGSKTFEGRQRRKDGSTFPVEVRVRLIQLDREYLIANVSDITARKLAEDELLQKTAFLEAQVDSALDGIVVVNEQGRHVHHNQRFNDLWKFPRHVLESDDDAAKLQFAATRVKNPQQFAEKIAYLYEHPAEVSRDEIELVDGTILDRYSSPVRDKAGRYYGRIWAFRDITEQRKLEVQFRQAQKMEAIGQLAGGVAHDFNNILAVIQMQAGLLKVLPDLPAEQDEIATEIENATHRAANLTRQLLLFSQRQEMRMREVDLNDIVTNIVKMLRRIVGEDIQMQFQLSPRPLLIHADPGMVDQILLNLTVNSRDAMPQGGHLVVETAEMNFDAFTVAKTSQARPGAFACLCVSDTGCGIPPENLPRIFEPFFSTKERGKGTGLGLATVFGIVKQHQGWISVYSEPGMGTTMRIYLPRLGKSSNQEAGQALLGPVPNGDETILVVEDDLAVRGSMRRILSHLGYQILEATTGAAALDLWEQHGADVHLLVTDLVLPDGMNGKELAGKLTAQKAGLKVVYVSGYSATVAGKEFALEEGVNFLSKPFDSSKLARTVRNCLDKH